MYQQKLRQVLASVGFDQSFRVLLPDGGEIVHGAEPPVFTVAIKTARALRDVVMKSSLGFGEAYARGDVDVEGDLQQVVLLGFRLREQLLRGAAWERLRYVLGFSSRRNTLVQSKENIAAHYDLSNDFYRLWLDAEMQYTCAYFRSPSDSLEDAQWRKMDLVCRKLDLKPGELVVEAGCGWGGLALHMARHWGVRVKSFNISDNQIAYARDRAQRLGLSTDVVEYIHDDYRNIPAHVARCDKFASICMLEHVGVENYPSFLDLIAGVLRPRGLAMLQFISRTRPSAAPNPWLEKHVFPGYYNPSMGELLSALEAGQTRIQLVDVENMRHHYALTLRHWLARFEANIEAIRAQWGEEVVRTFRLYLTGGLADFLQGDGTLVYQALLSHGADNAAPLTRQRQFAPRDAQQARPARVRGRETA